MSISVNSTRPVSRKLRSLNKKVHRLMHVELITSVEEVRLHTVWDPRENSRRLVSAFVFVVLSKLDIRGSVSRQRRTFSGDMSLLLRDTIFIRILTEEIPSVTLQRAVD